MLTGQLPPVSRRSTYIETLELLDDETGDPIDLSGAAITVSVCRMLAADDYGAVCAASCATATLGAGVTVPEPGIIVWRFEAGALGGIAPGVALLSVLISRDGDSYEALRALLPIED